jgi:hypothetical protein
MAAKIFRPNSSSNSNEKETNKTYKASGNYLERYNDCMQTRNPYSDPVCMLLHLLIFSVILSHNMIKGSIYLSS